MELPLRIGRYEVELLLGEGGTGRVLLARDPVLRRQVAIKVLRDDLGLPSAQRGERTERVREEARAASTLSHPAMVALHDMGDDERVGLYLVFDLVRGPTLRERLHEGPLPPAEVSQIARALGSALTHAHAAGLVHRGVKPENVMLASTGPKLTDFGLSHGDAKASAHGAPETASAAPGADTDQFSLAMTLYEALTGRPPFPGDDATARAKIASAKYAPPRSVLPALRGFLRLDAIFARALAKQPKKRFPSCDEFASALAAELDGPRITFLATPAAPRSSVSRATRRWQNSIALIAVAVILALLVIGRLRRTTERNEGGDTSQRHMGPGASMQRVVSAPPSSATGASAAATGGPRVVPLSSSVPLIDP